MAGGLISGSQAPLPESVAACTPCHSSGDSNQVSEWLASPYSAGLGGLVCIDCHDSRCDGTAPQTPAGLDAVASRRDALRGAAGLTLAVDRNGDTIEAEVAVSNLRVGHLLPSGAAHRKLILEVTARTTRGPFLAPATGPLLATADGNEGPVVRKVFARTASNSVLCDTRLAPFATDVSRVRFTAPNSDPVEVAARLLVVDDDDEPEEIATMFMTCREWVPVLRSH
jgi:hypothetical protein